MTAKNYFLSMPCWSILYAIFQSEYVVAKTVTAINNFAVVGKIVKLLRHGAVIPPDFYSFVSGNNKILYIPVQIFFSVRCVV